MTITRRLLLGSALAAPAIVRAQGTAPIRIGEINSYTAVPAFTLPYRNGWQLAVAQLNEAGGVLGRKLEVVSRDDAGQPQTAVRLAGAAMEQGFAGASFETPFGPAAYRSLDHQSTLGAFMGKTALKDGRGVMVDWHDAGGDTVMPPDDVVRTLRPA